MKIRTGVYLVAMLSLVLAEAVGAENAANYCRVAAVRGDALDWPAKHAWNLFLLLNHPALDKKFGRGLPDCTKPVGVAGTTALWETWRNASSEVYLADGREPPPWDDTSLPDEKPGAVPADDQGELSVHAKRMAAGKKIQFSPGDGVFSNSGGFGETRMNRPTFEFIRSECLFSKEGLQRYARAYGEGKKPAIKFPVDSIEVKAAWLDFDAEKIPESKRRTYYTAEYKGKKYGLSTLHVLTKDLPNWFWASFHHVDVPDNRKNETGDDYGRPPSLDGTVWANYVLGGTQVDYVKPTGEATILSDYYVEYNFQKSSCMTCHATASISKEGSMPFAQKRALCAMTLSSSDPDLDVNPSSCRTLLGEQWFQQGKDQLLFERGTPDPSWFKKDGVSFYLQSDFVYSIPFRAKKEVSAPPARCVW
ncbi:hypothetical protein ACUXAV_005818 [Cupriavidus metallidurans]|uniref:hypothetical protein n=1 Tax=Cupriavidus metallidurans TaxID=119219 RepID=UPI000AB63F81|nr:hypothetical protein [Cupriavidus metallidurans]MDE4922903.1 hypothetical protein [Cupriavidus metallidurans]